MNKINFNKFKFKTLHKTNNKINKIINSSLKKVTKNFKMFNKMIRI
jgi:hypothetical protein